MTEQEIDEYVRERCGNRKCEFEFEDGYWHCNKGNVLIFDEDGEGHRDYTCPHCHGTGYEPITLADVLMALQDAEMSKYNTLHTLSYRPISEHRFVITLSTFKWEEDSTIASIAWNLTTDFHGQDESTRLAIGELLK